MSRINLSTAPYYDDTDMSKRYYQLLAKPGHVAQAREITALQTTMREIIKSVGDSILRNGDIIEGCQVIVSGTTVTVTSGKVYIEGIVMPMSESSITITGVGTEVIGIKLNEDIVDDSIDSSLRDPAQGFDNYNQPGCDRLRRTLSLVLNDSTAANISTLVDGVVQIENYSPNYDTLNQTLARRTYDESGSYIVEGLTVRVEEITGSTDEYNVVVEAGKAYILGYELKVPVARRIINDVADTVNDVIASNYVFTEGVSEYILDDDPYVNSITSVIGRTSKTEAQTISSNLDSVLLDETDVVRITSVSQGGTEYTVGTSDSTGDCYLTREGTRYYLKWNGTINYPTTGTSYSVAYEYNKAFSGTTDYEILINSSGSYIKWKAGGGTPITDTSFTINYKQYLARKDIVYMDRYGNIEVLKGIPAENNFEVEPQVPLNTLVLARIKNYPNGSTTATAENSSIVVENIGLTRFTMSDIQGIVKRIKTIEYDQAVLTLNEDAKNVMTVNDKKGIFTDPLIDMSRMDFYFNLDSEGDTVDVAKPVYDAATDLISNLCYLPLSNHYSNLEEDTESSNTKVYSHYTTLNVTGENVVLEQLKATKSFLVNPYSMFPQLPEVSVSPSSDIWYDDSIIEIPRTITQSQVVSTSSSHVDVVAGGSFATYTTAGTSETVIGTRVSNPNVGADILTNSEVITYMRQITLTITGKDFAPNLDNIACYFDGKLVALTPTEGTSAGTTAGTIRANASGSLSATMTVPEGVLCGTREVLLKSNVLIDNYVTEGFTLYTAQGYKRTFSRTITTIRTLLLHRHTSSTTYIDPVGQSFVLDKMTLVKGIDVYFENVPSTETPIVCELRGVTNGLINEEIYAHKSLNPSEISVSATGETPTRFNFADPVLLEENKEYAFVLRSVSDDYRVWVAELGETDISTGDRVLRNTYMTGVMFSSSNNSTWTEHQTIDMKFRIVEDIYSSTSTIVFNELTLTDAARLYLIVNEIIPIGTSIDWLYSLDSGSNFNSITPYNVRLLQGNYNNVLLKAVLSRNNTVNLSPIIDLDTVLLMDSKYKQEGCYVSRNVTGLDSYTSVKVVLDVYKPAGTSMTIKVSGDDGSTLATMTEGTSTTLSYGWREVVYEVSVPSSTQFRIFIQMSSSTEYLTPAFRKLKCIMS